MEVFIVSGASRGLGAALVAQLLGPERRVIAISRKPNDALAQAARAAGAWLDWYLQDVADVTAHEDLARAICAELPRDASRYVLINNVGMLGPVGGAESLSAAGLGATLAVNATAPMVMTAQFLTATQTLEAERRIVHISSGLGRNPMAGSAAYCASKAALDMHARVVKTEQAQRANPARIVSLAPGVIDTDMQGELREKDPAALPTVQRFLDLKSRGELASAAVTAQYILAYVARPDFGTTEIDDIRNYPNG